MKKAIAVIVFLSLIILLAWVLLNENVYFENKELTAVVGIVAIVIIAIPILRR